MGGWHSNRNTKKPDINHLLAYQLALARDNARMTQKEFSERTGIYQADISKIERGIGNPSLSTLKRLADDLGMELRISSIKAQRTDAEEQSIT